MHTGTPSAKRRTALQAEKSYFMKFFQYLNQVGPMIDSFSKAVAVVKDKMEGMPNLDVGSLSKVLEQDINSEGYEGRIKKVVTTLEMMADDYYEIEKVLKVLLQAWAKRNDIINKAWKAEEAMDSSESKMAAAHFDYLKSLFDHIEKMQTDPSVRWDDKPAM